MLNASVLLALLLNNAGDLFFLGMAFFKEEKHNNMILFQQKAKHVSKMFL